MTKRFDVVLVIADKRESIEELTSGANALGANVYLAYTGPIENALSVQTAYHLGDDNVSFVNCIPAIQDLMEELNPQLVLCSPTKNGRLAAGMIAATRGISVLSSCSELHTAEDGVIVSRMVYGGTAVKVEKSSGALTVVCPAEGCFEPIESTPAQTIVEIPAKETGIRLLEKRKKQAGSKSITAAKNVVGVGRGLGSADNLPLAQALAKAIGGEVGCSRPVAEEYKWLPSELNVGISGSIIKPNMYVACGISGQIQHMVGINGSRSIVAINKDENAPIFSSCDFGIVGDINVVLPALLKKFEEST